MKTTPRLFALLLLLPLLTGCALFEPTVIHEAGMVSRSRQYELSPEHLAATPMLNEELTGVEYNERGQIVKADTVSRSWGIPPAPRELYFAASEDLADSDTNLRQDSNWTGTGVSATRSQVGNVGTAEVAGQTQVARGAQAVDAVTSVVGDIRAIVTSLSSDKTQVDVAKIQSESAVRLKEIEAGAAHAEAPAAEPAPVTP